MSYAHESDEGTNPDRNIFNSFLIGNVDDKLTVYVRNDDRKSGLK